MSSTDVRMTDGIRHASVGTVDMKLEVVTIPVSDLDRAKEFYGGLGWRLDADFSHGGDRAIADADAMLGGRRPPPRRARHRRMRSA